MEPLRFFLNGKAHTVLNANPRMSLADYLRSDEIRLMGTKVADNEGLTGMDTVSVVDFDETNSKVRIRPLLAALFPLIACQGKNVITIEGLGNIDKMHPVQKQFSCCNPTQCGYCEGGFIMSLYTLLRNKEGKVKCNDIENCFDGTICRCTGYNPIIAASATFAEDCSSTMGDRWKIEKQSFDPKAEPEHPKLFSSKLSHTFSYVSSTTGDIKYSTVYYAPSTLTEYFDIIKANPDCQVINGNTHRLLYKHENIFGKCVVSLQAIKELNGMTVSNDIVELGASRSIEELLQTLEKLASVSLAISDASKFCRFVLSTQRRNQATIGGELFHSFAEPDLPVLLSGINATVKFIPIGSDINKVEECKVSELSSKQIKLILSISFKPNADENKHRVYFFREAMRKVNFPPYFSGALTKNSLFLGGLLGRKNSFPHVSLYADVAKKLFAYNRSEDIEKYTFAAIELVQVPQCDRYSAFRKLSIRGHFEKALIFFGLSTNDEKVTTECVTHFGLPHTERHWPDAVTAKVGHNTKLLSARVSATGNTLYTIDASAPGLLHSVLVLAQKPGHKILGFDTKEALSSPGVISFFCAKDIKGKNVHSGIVPADTKVFQDDVCTHFNEPCGLIVAETRALADYAAKKVKVLYSEEKVKDVYPDIKSAMEANSYHHHNDVGAMVVTGGDLEKGFAESDGVYETECFMGGQDHTYAEPINAIVIPEEDNCLTAIVSCQNMGKCQADIASVLAIPHSKITSKVNHLGGGFGGKQDRPAVFATPCALAAYTLKRPVRLSLTREEDMLISGGRHPFYYKYKVGYKNDGRINAVDILLVGDGGSTYDVTHAVLNKALFQSNGPYTYPNFRCEGRAVRTSRVSNTAYRGFGGPQGAFVAEHILQNVSMLTKIPPEQVRLINLNKPGDVNISGTYNQKDFRVAEDNSQRCWDQLVKDTDIMERAQSCREFNKTSKRIKRSVGVCNVRNGTLFEERFMNQANALVHVVKDGSVIVAHSGVEMGQGLHEKVRLAVTEILPVSREVVRILETSTDTCSNTQPTSASSGNDVNVTAVTECCKMIFERLKPRLDKGQTWESAVNSAYFNAEDLHASYHFSGPYDLQYDWEYYKPGPATGPTGLYNGYGSAAVEVELDTLTGDWKIVQTNLLEDAGRPLNPFSDLGQVEGGYVMGTALMTTEEVAWDCEGHQETDCLATYAIPSLADVPRKLVSGLLDDAPNESSRAFKSKACEETPTLFGCSTLFALMNTIASARADRGKNGPFKMDSPATKHSILPLIYGDN